MIAIRRCRKCKRVYDSVGPAFRMLCPVCEQGELFEGEYTEDMVFVPDTRSRVEEAYRQTAKQKKGLEEEYSMNCSMAWEKPEESEDDITDEDILEQLVEEFEPVLADVTLASNLEFASWPDNVIAKTRGSKHRGTIKKEKRQKATARPAPIIRAHGRSNPYTPMKGKN